MWISGMTWTAYDKYDTQHGMASLRGLEHVDPRFRQHVKDLQNSRLAYNSWRSIASALRVKSRFEEDWDLELPFPWSEGSLLNFILCGYEKRLKASTIECYVARLSSWQDLEYGSPIRWSNRARQVLRGMRNIELPAECSRKAATPKVMRLLKLALRKSGWPVAKRRLVWLVATWSFFGALRSNEILTVTVEKFVKNATLLHDHVTVTEYMGSKLIVVKLINTKEKKGSGVTFVELFRAPDSFMCPVTAYEKFMGVSRGPTPGTSPLVMVNGQGYTR